MFNANDYYVKAHGLIGKLITFFNNDFAPDLISMCYSTKIDNQFYNSIYQRASSYFSQEQVGLSTYWSPSSLQFTEGMNIKNLGVCGLEKEFDILPEAVFPAVSAPPEFTAGYIGSHNIWCFLCDWHGPKGFKFK